MARRSPGTANAWTIPATVIWTFAYVSVGTFAAGAFESLSGNLHLAMLVFAGIIAVFVVVVFLVKRLLSSSTAKDRTGPAADGTESEDFTESQLPTDPGALDPREFDR